MKFALPLLASLALVFGQEAPVSVEEVVVEELSVPSVDEEVVSVEVSDVVADEAEAPRETQAYTYANSIAKANRKMARDQARYMRKVEKANYKAAKRGLIPYTNVSSTLGFPGQTYANAVIVNSTPGAMYGAVNYPEVYYYNPVGYNTVPVIYP